MENKRLFKLIAVISMLTIFSILLAACRLPASEGPAGEEETPGPNFPVPGETDQEMGGIDINQINTQTAMAELMQTSVVVADTPVAAVTATTGGEAAPAPQAEATQVPAPQEQQPAPVEIEPTPGMPTSYTLQNGEWPFCIARRFDVNQYELLNLNGLNLNSKPRVGFTLKIPQTGNNFVGDVSLRDHPTNYTVKAGDTVYTIACAFGNVSPDMIALANNLSAPYELSSGQTLRIP